MIRKQIGPSIAEESIPSVALAIWVFLKIPVYRIVWLDGRGTYARVRLWPQ